MPIPSPTSSHSSQSTHNEVPFTRDLLILALNDFSMRILKVFGRPIQLVVHGGAVMILHPTLASSTSRRTTRDVDFIKRSFITEMRKSGVYDAEARLQSCINATAKQFHLGTDWFNADADVALPMAQKYVPMRLLLPSLDSFPASATSRQGQPYDPIYWDSLKRNNVAMNTIYTSPGLTLISVAMFWGVALKMVRYQKGAGVLNESISTCNSETAAQMILQTYSQCLTMERS